METEGPAPVKLFVAILWADTAACAAGQRRLEDAWGALDFVGPDRPFVRTDYYEAEMGPGLHRRLVGLEALVSPEVLASAKRRCIQWEAELAVAGKRRVNLDVGYLDHNKLVLASVKAAGQKIYLSDGVYADLVARYGRGRYQPFEWTFPDFKDGGYDEELAALRRLYLDARKRT